MRCVLTVTLIALALFETPSMAAEGSFRCGRGRLAHAGETRDDIARKCGAADAVTTWSEIHTESVWENGHSIERQVEVVYDEWKYDLGRNRLVRYLTFANGRLFDVATGSYGE